MTSETILTEVGNPFGVPIRFDILDAKRDKVSSPVILGADTYVAGSYKRQENAELAFGYSFEKFVLYASELGLGTVWYGLPRPSTARRLRRLSNCSRMR